MPQSGFTPVQTYSSSTPGNVPLAANLINSTQGAEMAINIADGKLFYKDSGGTVQILATKGGVGSSTTTQVLYNSSGLVVGSANMTFNGTTLTLANDASISGLTVGKGNGNIVYNTAVGTNALSGSNTGSGLNVAFGYNALAGNTSGTNNSSVGINALVSNTSASYNSAFGAGALQTNTTGASNTAIGVQSLTSNTTASNNTAVGYQAGYSNTTGQYNTFIGQGAGYANTASNNTYIGQNAGVNTTTGTQNTFVGPSVPTIGGPGTYVTSGSYNTILGGFSGNQGGLNIATANGYIVLSDGYGNPRQVIDSSGNVGIGNTSPATYGKLAVAGSIVATGSTGALVINRRDTNVYSAAIYSASGGMLWDLPTIGTALTLNGSTANLQFGVSNAGIIFNNSSALTNSTLNDYETGTWTPTVSNSGLTSYSSSATYTKVGRLVQVQGVVTILTPGTASGALLISNLPFTSATTVQQPSLVREQQLTGLAYQAFVISNNTNISINTLTNGGVVWLSNYAYSFNFTYVANF